MILLKKPYEISVWEDIVIYVGTDGNEYRSPSSMPDGVITDYQYYSEQLLAVIGSSTMTSLARTTNNILKRNINGVETLTFDMYYLYQDEETGSIIRNPLIDLVIDERKVKLYYDNKWYDFIVKKDDEKGRENKYSFTCTGLAANELGKTGFRVELDTELENNIGTVKLLGESILEGSDWSMGEMDESIKLTNDEALYRIKLNTNITGTIRGTSNTKSISSGSYIYVYYTTYINLVEDYFQFIYVDSNSGLGTPNLYDDKITIYCNNTAGGTYDLYIDDVIWTNGEPSFRDTEDPKIVSDYRGRRYVRKLLTGYDAVLKRPIYKYKGAPGHQSLGVIQDKSYYGYTTTEYCDATSVTNYIYNSIDFGGTSYWYSFGNNASLDARVYPDTNYVDDYNIVHNKYLILNFGTNANARAVNEGISKNYSRINKFEKGEKYRFKVWVGQENSGVINRELNLPFKCIVKKYIDIDLDSENDKIYFTFNGNGTQVYGKIVVTENNWEPNTYYTLLNGVYTLSTEYIEETTYYLLYLCIDATCENSATWDELKDKTGIFLYPRSSSNLNHNYYIRDIQFYRYIENENGDVMDINDVPEVRVLTHYHFYDPDINAGFLSEDEYIYNNNNKDYYLPLYGSGENEFEKVRSITAKESNRFNLLLDLCETFECWVRFDIAHNANGLILIEEYDYYKPIEIKGGCGLNGTIGLERGSIGTSGQDIGFVGYYVRHDYVEVTPNWSYTLTSNIPIIEVFWYNENKEFISRIEKTLNNIYTPPINAYYMRFTLSKSTSSHMMPTEPNMVKELNLYPNGVYYYNKTENTYLVLTNYRATDVFYTLTTRKRLSKKVIFYEEVLQDNFVGFKYGINLKDNNRTLDSELIVTKIIVKDNTCELAKNGFCTIARAQDNPLKENFALNLDYYITLGLINKLILDNDLYLELIGSVGLYPRLSRLNNGYTLNGIRYEGKNLLIEELAERLNSITNLSALYLAASVTYDEATKELSKLLDPVSGTIVRYTGYRYLDFGNQYIRKEAAETYAGTNVPAYGNEVYYIRIDEGISTNLVISSGTTGFIFCEHLNTPTDEYPSGSDSLLESQIYVLTSINSTEFNANKAKYWYKSGNEYILCDNNSVYNNSTTYYRNGYFTLENNHFVPFLYTKFSSVEEYYKLINPRTTTGTYFQTAPNTTTLSFTPHPSSNEVGGIEQGSLSSSTHENVSSLYRVRTEEYIPVIPNATYVINCKIADSDNNIGHIMIDNFSNNTSNSFVSRVGWYTPLNYIYTVPSNVNYIRIIFAKNKNTNVEISPEDVSFSNVFVNPEVYIYAAARRIINLNDYDYINDNSTISYITSVITLLRLKDKAANDKKVYNADLDEVLADYDADKIRLEDIAKATEEIEKEFNTKYSRYIQEGSWSDENYMDDDLYYLDALDVLYLSAYPKVTYNFKVLELSLLEGYEAFKFDLADKTFVEDVEFFGYLWVNGIKTPARETVVITEVTSNLDEPDKNDLKILNYKSHFQDLFQRVTAATQNLEYHSGEYNRAAQVVTPSGAIDENALLSSFDGASYIIQNSRDLSVIWNDTGIIATNINDPAQVTRLASGGLMVSSDGGQTWSVAITGYGINADNITAGTINADLINIMSGSFPSFRWDANGLRAYRFTTEDGINRSYDPTTYVSHDLYGIYGISGFIVPPTLNSVEDVENTASFALTWNGLFMRSTHRAGYVRVSPSEDIALYSTLTNGSTITDVLRGKFGLLGESGGEEIYGLALYGQDGNATIETKSNGTLWLKSLMDIGVPTGTTTYIGVGLEATLEEIALVGNGHGKKVISIHGAADSEYLSGGEYNVDRFAIFEDGYLLGHGEMLLAGVTLPSGTIGGLSVEELPKAVGTRIVLNLGDTFKLDENGIPTPTSLSFGYESSVAGTLVAVWTYGTVPLTMGPVPAGWISQDGKTVTLPYDYLEEHEVFRGGLMYLKCTVNSTYSALIAIKLNLDGKSADAYSYNIESSEGYIINATTTIGHTTLLTASVYKNGTQVPWSGFSSITWKYKTDSMLDFETAVLDGLGSIFTRVTSGIDYIVNLNYLNLNSILIYFIVEEAST